MIQYKNCFSIISHNMSWHKNVLFFALKWQCQVILAWPFSTLGDLSAGTGAGACTALTHHWDGNSSWDDLERCPVGAVESSAGADSARAGGSSKRRRHEREKWGENRFRPLLFPLVSVISFRRRGNNFLFLSVSFHLKMAFNAVGRWEQRGNQKESRYRIWGHLPASDLCVAVQKVDLRSTVSLRLFNYRTCKLPRCHGLWMHRRCDDPPEKTLSDSTVCASKCREWCYCVSCVLFVNISVHL